MIKVYVCDRVRGGWGNYRYVDMTIDEAGTLLRNTLELREIGRSTMPDDKRHLWSPSFFATPIGDTVYLSCGGTLSEIRAVYRATVD